MRLRAGRRDLVSCELYVADRACETTPIRFEGLPMERIARDERFDFFQAVFPIRHTVSQRATTYDDNVVFTFKDRKEVTI